MATVLVFDVKENNFHVAECETLDDFYRELDADIFDIVHYPVGEKSYDIFVDDLGLYREDKIVSAVSLDNKPVLVGNLIFANHDELGNTTSISQEDILNITAHTSLILSPPELAGQMVVGINFSVGYYEEEA